MEADMACTFWFSGWWLHCCQAHDLGASDEFLFSCVWNSAPALLPGLVMATVMYLGLKLFGPVYRFFRKPR